MSPSQLPNFLYSLSQWRNTQAADPSFGLHTIIAWLLCFVAASISSAGGVGGGSLYLPILNLIAGMDLKTAAAFSAFMVTSGSVSNVLFNLFFTKYSKSPAIIDYEIALLSEPSMLLGVSIGVVCNVMFPEWLITALFSIFLGCSTYKTCKAGCKCWKSETDGIKKDELCYRLDEEKVELLLGEKAERREAIPWRKMVVLLMIWVSFFVLHVLVGRKDGKKMKMEALQICIAVAAVVALIQTAVAANIKVGGANGGWDLSTDLQSWASSQTFATGDTLNFSFGSIHTVVEVSKTDYDACTVNNPMQVYLGSSAVVRLSSQGKRYFICGAPGHCSQGMKMEINIASASKVTSAPPTASPLIPTPTITSPPPARELVSPPSISAPPKVSPLIPTPTISSPPPDHDLVMTPPSIPANAPMIPSEAPMLPPAAAGDATSGSAAERSVPETHAIHSPAPASPAPEATPGKNSGGRKVETRIMLVVSLLIFLAP